MSTVLVFFLVFVVTLLLSWRLRKPSGVPPGPSGIPIFGNLISLAKDPQLVLKKWGRQYGDVFSVYFGPHLVVVLNSLSAIKEVLIKQGDNFAARPRLFLFDALNEVPKSGLVNSEGTLWSEHRKFSIQVLREFGVGKTFMQDQIQEEVRAVNAVIEEKQGQPMNIKHLIGAAVSNIICQLVFGKRFDYDDEQFVQDLKAIEYSFEAMGNSGIMIWLPWTRFLPTYQKIYRHLMKDRDFHKYNILKPEIKRHIETFDRENIRDFMDAYLKELQDRKGTDTTMNEVQLEKTTNDLFAAGTETTTTTLRWALLFFLHNPQVQEKVQQELDQVVGRSRQAQMKDRPQLPYTEATIMEIQRLGNIAPFSLLHCNFEDAIVNGYKIPARTIILPNLNLMLSDPEYWSEPEKFKPQRFLDSQGKLLPKCDAFMPFSVGRRVCAGEILAKTELFLFLTGLLQQFTFKPVNEKKLPTLEGVMGLSYSPREFQIVAVAR